MVKKMMKKATKKTTKKMKNKNKKSSEILNKKTNKKRPQTLFKTEKSVLVFDFWDVVFVGVLFLSISTFISLGISSSMTNSPIFPKKTSEVDIINNEFSIDFLNISAKNSREKGYQISIFYDNLTFEEKEIIKNILNNVKFDYLKHSKIMIFSKNSTLIDGKGTKSRLGVNYGNGDIIYVKYNNKFTLSRVICHELLHSLGFRISHEDEERIVVDLEKQNVCYG